MEKRVFAIPMAEKNRLKQGPAPVIFVVDDEPMLLDLAQMILKAAGFDVRTYRDPGLALADYTAAPWRPSLLITDYAMNGMNGMDLLRECRRLRPEQKAILVSGTVDESVFAGADIKPDSFVAKPYDPEQFVALVKSLAGDAGKNEKSHDL